MHGICVLYVELKTYPYILYALYKHNQSQQQTTLAHSSLQVEKIRD